VAIWFNLKRKYKMLAQIQQYDPERSMATTVSFRCHVRLDELTPDGLARGIILSAEPVCNADAAAHPAFDDLLRRCFPNGTLAVIGGLPGEEVIVEGCVLLAPPQRRRRWRLRPRLTLCQVLVASPWRVPAPCPHFGVCGGCQYQHVSYDQQLVLKQQRVRALLLEQGFPDPPVPLTIGCPVPWCYRNHMRFSVTRDGRLGLTVHGTHQVFPVGTCLIAHERIAATLAILQTQPNRPPQAVIRCGAATGQVLVQPAPDEATAMELRAAGIDLHTDSFQEKLAGKTFSIRPSSFFQTNTVQAERMVDLVIGGLHAGSESAVVDAYCGVGTFTLALATHCGRVIGIEESASAVADARANLEGMPNAMVIQGKTEQFLPSLGETIDGVVLDPPRQGCQRPVLAALARRRVPRLVYVSCDPTTLARDLAILCHEFAAYRLVAVQPLDMFPQTAHIECVATLEAQQ
jgi:23S rRNA (uracil1939-C5)-methyltransferase